MNRETKMTWLLMFLLLIIQQGAAAQGRKVAGKVTDAGGNALVGVSIAVKGAAKGAATNNNGQFQLTLLPGEKVLVFKLLGFNTLEQGVDGNGPVNVTLTESPSQLNEMVVIGYAAQKKVNLTGAISVIRGQELARRPVASTSLALQGAAPGVTVIQSSGLPGGDAGSIRVRGIGSLKAGTNPLVLIDNVEMSLDNIDANNIESISVLKDAAAAAIYGSRAANGVILITTKRGRDHGMQVQYNGYAGWQKATNIPEKVDALEHMKLFDIARVNIGQQPSFTQAIKDYEQLGPDNFSRFNTDWEGQIIASSALMHSHNLSLSTGTEKVRLFASGSYLNQEGITKNTNSVRADFRFNTDIKLSNQLTASMDMALNKRENNYPGGDMTPENIIRWAIGLAPTQPGRFNSGEYGEGWLGRNPIAMAENSGFRNSVINTRLIAGTLTYKPLAGLEILATYNSNAINYRNRTLVKQYQYYRPDVPTKTLILAGVYPTNNSLTDGIIDTNRDLFRTQASYTRRLGLHQLTALGGFSFEKFKTSDITGFRRDLINPDQPYLSNGNTTGQTVSGTAATFTMVSAYGRLNYSYNDKYLFEVNGRWDASSRFQEQYRWQLFPSVSAGWRISQEPFWKGVSHIVSDAKIRGSYGTLGNQDIGSYYPTYATFQPGNNYYFNGALTSGYALTTAANPNIKWETSRQLDIGADLGFLKNRLNITADYFKRDIINMLQDVNIPAYVGLAPPFVNIGSMTNKGWELGIEWKDQVRDFRYQVQVFVTDITNRVTDLGGRRYISGNLITTEGANIYTYYGYIAEGLFQSTDEIANAPFHFSDTKPGDIRYRDVSGPDGKPDNKIDSYDRVNLGNHMPRYEYSANLNMQWKGFDLTLFLQGVGKRDNYLSGAGSQAFYSPEYQGTVYKYMEDFWTPENPHAAYPRLTLTTSNNYVPSSYWIKSGAYLRLKNVDLGYTLPKKWTDRMRISSWRVYAGGQNLFTWTKFYSGFDPEIPNNTGMFYPIMKTYTVGMNIKF